MIKLLLKHTLYQLAIDACFNNLIVNLNSNIITIKAGELTDDYIGYKVLSFGYRDILYNCNYMDTVLDKIRPNDLVGYGDINILSNYVVTTSKRTDTGVLCNSTTLKIIRNEYDWYN